MNRKKHPRTVEKVKRGHYSEQGVDRLQHCRLKILGYARVDHSPAPSCGTVSPRSSSVWGKIPGMFAGIVRSLLPQKSKHIDYALHPPRWSRGCERSLQGALPQKPPGQPASFRTRPFTGRVIHVVCAGTSDIPVVKGCAHRTSHGERGSDYLDAGVAGIHRLLSAREALTQARVVIAVAGMEGASPASWGGAVSAFRSIAVPPASVTAALSGG